MNMNLEQVIIIINQSHINSSCPIILTNRKQNNSKGARVVPVLSFCILHGSDYFCKIPPTPQYKGSNRPAT